MLNGKSRIKEFIKYDPNFAKRKRGYMHRKKLLYVSMYQSTDGAYLQVTDM